MKAKVRRLSHADVDAELRLYEEKYGMSSVEFWERYFGGDMGDDHDFILWVGLCRMQRAAANRIKRAV